MTALVELGKLVGGTVFSMNWRIMLVALLSSGESVLVFLENRLRIIWARFFRAVDTIEFFGKNIPVILERC